MQNTAKQDYPGLVAFYNTRPVNEVGLFYNTPASTQGTMVRKHLEASKATVKQSAVLHRVLLRRGNNRPHPPSHGSNLCSSLPTHYSLLKP